MAGSARRVRRQIWVIAAAASYSGYGDSHPVLMIYLLKIKRVDGGATENSPYRAWPARIKAVYVNRKPTSFI